MGNPHGAPTRSAQGAPTRSARGADEVRRRGLPKERPRRRRGAPTRTAQGTPEARTRCPDKDCPRNAHKDSPRNGSDTKPAKVVPNKRATRKEKRRWELRRGIGGHLTFFSSLSQKTKGPSREPTRSAQGEPARRTHKGRGRWSNKEHTRGAPKERPERKSRQSHAHRVSDQPKDKAVGAKETYLSPLDVFSSLSQQTNGPRSAHGEPTWSAQGAPEGRTRRADKDCPRNARDAEEVRRQGLPRERPRRGRGVPTRTAQGTP